MKGRKHLKSKSTNHHLDFNPTCAEGKCMKTGTVSVAELMPLQQTSVSPPGSVFGSGRRTRWVETQPQTLQSSAFEKQSQGCSRCCLPEFFWLLLEKKKKEKSQNGQTSTFPFFFSQIYWLVEVRLLRRGEGLAWDAVSSGSVASFAAPSQHVCVPIVALSEGLVGDALRRAALVQTEQSVQQVVDVGLQSLLLHPVLQQFVDFVGGGAVLCDPNVVVADANQSEELVVDPHVQIFIKQVKALP